MKKLIIICTLILILFVFEGCKHHEINESKTDVEKESNVATQQVDTELSDTYDSDLQIIYDSYEISWAYLPEYSGVENSFVELVDKDDYEKWVNDFKHINPDGTRESYEYSIYSFIKDFNISKEEFSKINYKYGDMTVYTDEEIDMLFCGDEEYIFDSIINPYAIRKGTNIYTPYWLATHTVADYISEGLTADSLSDKYDMVISILPDNYKSVWEKNYSIFMLQVE